MYRMYGTPRAHGEGMDARSRVTQEQLPNAHERGSLPARKAPKIPVTPLQDAESGSNGMYGTAQLEAPPMVVASKAPLPVRNGPPRRWSGGA